MWECFLLVRTTDSLDGSGRHHRLGPGVAMKALREALGVEDAEAYLKSLRDKTVVAH
jgi:hypothetical protein